MEKVSLSHIFHTKRQFKMLDAKSFKISNNTKINTISDTVFDNIWINTLQMMGQYLEADPNIECYLLFLQ